MTGWRLLHGAGDGALAAATGARNMAVDHALLESAQAGGAPVLRLYRWHPACLSFGRNQHTLGIYDPARIRAASIDCVRRPTGGLAVLHDHELTYSVTAPAGAFGGVRVAYHRINAALVDGLRRLGVPAVLAGAGPRRGPLADAAEPCFQTPAEGEVVADGRKLVGSAQRAERHALLQHGSILVGGSQTVVLDLLASSVAAGAITAAPGDVGHADDARTITMPAPSVAATTLTALLGAAPAWDDLAACIAAGFATVCGTRLAPDTLTRTESDRAGQLETRYADAAWTWRR